MRAAAQDFGRFEVTRNAVLSGWVRTEMAERKALQEAEERGLPVEAVWAERATTYPAGPVLTPREVAQPIAFLGASGRAGSTARRSRSRSVWSGSVRQLIFRAERPFLGHPMFRGGPAAATSRGEGPACRLTTQLEHLVNDLVARHIDRRQFVRRALGLGLSFSAAGALLAACGGDDEGSGALNQVDSAALYELGVQGGVSAAVAPG